MSDWKSDYERRINDPRWKRAVSLFDAEDWNLGAGHARGNIRYAICQAATGEDTDAIERVVNFWIKPQFRAAYLERARSIASSAARAE